MIKIVTALFALACLIVFASAQTQHCFDKSFQTRVRVFEPKRDFFDTQTMYVDADAGLTRIDMLVREPVSRNVSVYLNYNTMKSYTYDIVTGTCNVIVLSQPQQPFCISSNATYARSDVLGGTLKVDVYEEKVFGFQAKISYAPNTNIPVSVITKAAGVGSGYVIEEFFNWIHQKPASAVFTLPAACQRLSGPSMRMANSDSAIIGRVQSLLFRNAIKKASAKL
ncbi:predicted protein [Naegleria gruberi]|uniref:Predicted protein n=1 Tax=Naegleria gruberi TaxID=5762 RepID=D2VM59_NAEGR|nr:uncharacterized protein NAEGRDRAFT_70020 [Naegleria gruberi]EFC42264.1 predicted protein [Naegleria gruberi]|eukprot:XP_002675008.1 predicted protein [Naegleria gruberi strain NEG-M]